MVTPESILATRQKIDRQKRLEWNENEIRKGMNSVASSLRDIHEKKLWQDGYSSFEDYCQQKFGMSRQRAYQLIGAEGNRLMLADATAHEPELAAKARSMNDLQAAEFTKLDPAQAVEVLRDAAGQPGKLTAKKIKQAKARVVGTEQNLPMHTVREIAASIPVKDSTEDFHSELSRITDPPTEAESNPPPAGHFNPHEIAEMLAAHGIIDECAVHDAEGYDAGKMMARVAKFTENLNQP